MNKLPKDFNWKTYIKLNCDLTLFNNKEEAIKHYLDYGSNEKRQYTINIPIDFDWKIYIFLNHDLREITNKKDAINHYINFGFHENRIYKKEVEIILRELINNKKINIKDNLFLTLNTIIKYNVKSSDEFVNHSKTFFDKNKNIKFNFPNIPYNKIAIEDDLSLYSYFNVLPYAHNHSQEKSIFFDYKFIKFSNIYESFILILDLPEDFYGGSKFFINSIIDKYKKNQNFIILRSTRNNLIKININNNIFFNYEYDTIIIKKILEKIKEKITKIFINHIYGFSSDLINYLFDSNNKVSVITHDHYLFNSKDNKTQLMYYEINRYIYKNKEFKYDLNLFENIITQNKKNLYLFKNATNLKNIVVSELPDFKESDEIIITNNNYTVIGVIGNISNIKGFDFVKYLIDYFEQTPIKIVIFGKLYDSNYEYCYPYNNIDELNNLLKKYKPNMLLECSLWPETFSYTLSLSMITDLPILVLQKKFSGVIQNRIKNYKKKYYFDNINDLLPLIIDNKQNYFKTIKPTIYFNKFWDNYFGSATCYEECKYEYYIKINKHKIEEVNNKNVILITSKIYVSDKIFSYSKNRSLYTSEGRFEQTIKTILTIKEKIPDYFIVLFDNSNFTEEEGFLLNKSVDCFINITNDSILNYYTNDCEYKYLADLCQQINSYYYFFKLIDNTKIINFFKLSGRYYLNDEFNYNIFNNNCNIFKKNMNITDRDYYYTSFFKISNNFLQDYFFKLIYIFENKGKYFDLDLEVIYGKCLLDHMTVVDKLGVTQLISCSHEISNI
jgi:hypothetical protein